MRHVTSCCLCVVVGLIPVVGCSAARDPAAERIVVEGRGFAVRTGERTRPFTPWGFNYDRTVIDVHDMLLEDAMRHDPAVVDADFAAMRRLGGNVVRIFISTGEILRGPEQVNREGLAMLDQVLKIAKKNDIKVILVGLATIRPASIPRWMQSASDEQMEAAELLFWRTVARACRGRSEIFTYDLQNEPVVHWSNSDSWIVGCFDMPGGQKFCYVHQHYRRIEAKWTKHVQAKYGTEEALKAHWPDYPRAGESWNKIAVSAFDGKDPRFAEYAAWNTGVFAAWAKGLASVIRAEDATHLITVGALDPTPLADAVDFYCYHLYPPAAGQGEDYLAKSRADWEQRLAKVPQDKPQSVRVADVLDAMLETTRARCAGWVSFYWGAADRMTWTGGDGRQLYESWLAAWSAAAPG
jgi:hypothetical protein